MKAARRAQRITQRDIAARLGVKQSTISDIESGETMASPLVSQISRFLHIDQPDYVTGDDFSERWRKLESRLREQSPELAEQVLELAETLAEKLASK